MRTGLDKPGALSLLMVVIFSLLTLAPSLSNFYNLKLADFTYNINGARRMYKGIGFEMPGARANGQCADSEMPLINEPVAEFSPDTSPIEYRTSWITTAQYKPRGSRMSRSSRSGNNLPTVPGEITPVVNKSRLSYSTAESSFMLSRRARAFRTYFIQQLDDYQFFTPFSNRSSSTETTYINPTSPPSNPSPRPTSLDEPSSENTQQLNNEPTSSYKEPTNWLRLQLSPLLGMWQQACHATIDLWKITPGLSSAAPIKNCKSSWKHATSFLRDNQAKTNQTPVIPQSQDSQARTNVNVTSSFPAQVLKPANLSHDESTDAAIRKAPELKGSCMAVVIGLVVGIVWF
ncbi:uncharacterized protein N7469_001422 [Penicillium citrinum]|uniref:Uncharacterized protein n=2 Tax=Penicillium TaxID=5073 RepID=A0A9W9PEF9_PENCI|nr:uncharacterized protein N7469_001422 [Penicillium citrinum]KAJ5243095.1 hypothetical protein N7469_001422 [Penicillium citrinum]KAJ5599405.1 hypothetical protein N7450_000472 [Penicillium hetheringtonii]